MEGGAIRLYCIREQFLQYIGRFFLHEQIQESMLGKLSSLSSIHARDMRMRSREDEVDSALH